MSENQKQWYVVRAIGGKENKVKEYLEAEIRRSHLEEYISLGFTFHIFRFVGVKKLNFLT